MLRHGQSHTAPCLIRQRLALIKQVNDVDFTAVDVKILFVIYTHAHMGICSHICGAVLFPPYHDVLLFSCLIPTAWHFICRLCDSLLFLAWPSSRPPGNTWSNMLPDMLCLTVDTNLPALDRFPDCIDPVDPLFNVMATANPPENKLLGKIQAELQDPSRHPSPQPTHFSVPVSAQSNGIGHRVLRSATVGYVAPEFVGKLEQMQQGQYSFSFRFRQLESKQPM